MTAWTIDGIQWADPGIKDYWSLAALANNKASWWWAPLCSVDQPRKKSETTRWDMDNRVDHNQSLPEIGGNVIHIEDEQPVSIESDLRRAINMIQSDDSLDPTTKARKMQVTVLTFHLV